MTTNEAIELQEQLEKGLIEGLSEVKDGFLKIFPGMTEELFYKILASAAIKKIKSLESEYVFKEEK